MAKEDKVNKYTKFNTLDDFTKDMFGSEKEIEASFKAYDTYNHEDNQLHLANNIFHPAMDDMYAAFKTEMNKLGKDTDKVTNKHKELKKAAVAGLKKFFEKADPSILGIKELETIKDDEKLYDVLVAHYDRITGRNPQEKGGAGLIDIIEQLSKDKKATIGHALNKMYSLRDQHTKRALQHLSNQFSNHLFSKYNNAPHKLGAYVRKDMEKYQWDVVDPLQFTKNELQDYLAIRDGIVHKRWAEGMDADAISNTYGVAQKIPPEPKK